jgi:hypothetical protein
MIDNFKANRGLYAAIGKTLKPIAESDEQPELFSAAGHPHNDDPDFHTVHQKSSLVISKAHRLPSGGWGTTELGRHSIGEQVHKRNPGESADAFDARVADHIASAHATYNDQNESVGGEYAGGVWDGIRGSHDGEPHGTWLVAHSMPTHHFLAPEGQDKRDEHWVEKIPGDAGIQQHVEHHFRIVK